MHADLNSFFASAEQQTKPGLRGKPVGILKAKGRTCLIAASDEAKKLGVKTGCNIYDAKRVCPQIILIPADFSRYEMMTRQFIRLANEFSDAVEVFSLDEVFLDITDIAWWFGGAVSLAKKLQARVRQELGEFIGCSVGIAENKLLAKMASGMAPRRGILVITPKNKAELLARAPFSEVCGIGRRLAEKLKSVGIVSLPQILTAADELLLPLVGPYWTKELKRLARGEDNSSLIPLENLPVAKSVSRSYTLFKDTRNPYEIKGLIRNLCEEAAWKLRRLGLASRQFGISVRGEHYSRAGYHTAKSYTDDGREIFDRVFGLYQSWRWPYAVRFAGIWVSLLARQGSLPLPLFPEPRRRRALQAVDQLNGIYGEYTVYPAVMLYSKIIRPEINGYLGDKQFRFRSG